MDPEEASLNQEADNEEDILIEECLEEITSNNEASVALAGLQVLHKLVCAFIKDQNNEQLKMLKVTNKNI